MRLMQAMEAAADAQPEQKRARADDADDADGAVDAVFTDDAQEPIDLLPTIMTLPAQCCFEFMDCVAIREVPDLQEQLVEWKWAEPANITIAASLVGRYWRVSIVDSFVYNSRSNTSSSIVK